MILKDICFAKVPGKGLQYEVVCRYVPSPWWKRIWWRIQLACRLGLVLKVCDDSECLQDSIPVFDAIHGVQRREPSAPPAPPPEARDIHMTVYVLNRAYDYEGEQTIGVFSTKDAAVKVAQKEAKDRGCDEPLKEIAIDVWATSSGDVTQWNVHTFNLEEPPWA